MSLKAPVFLKKKDKVALIATAKNFEKKELVQALAVLRQWGLEVVEGPHLYEHHHQFAGTDEQRLQDLQWAFDDVEIKAIFCARGGYGTARIIDELKVRKFKKNPKWVIGFSDVTTLHGRLQQSGIQSIHGVMPVQFSQAGYTSSIEKLKAVLFGKKLSYKTSPHALNRIGTTTGVLTGGNLSIVCASIGTASEVNTKNKILFLEDVGENLYRIDRMMVQLKRAGVLKALGGLLVGHFSAMEDNKVKFGQDAYSIIADAVKEYHYPVVYGFPAGHEPENLPLILGASVKMSCTSQGARLTFV
jgi:muramoyltetrapeptide carboxypeptidase